MLKRPLLILALIVTAAFGLRLAAVLALRDITAGPDPALTTDGHEYDQLAYRLVQGQGQPARLEHAEGEPQHELVVAAAGADERRVEDGRERVRDERGEDCRGVHRVVALRRIGAGEVVAHARNGSQTSKKLNH